MSPFSRDLDVAERLGDGAKPSDVVVYSSVARLASGVTRFYVNHCLGNSAEKSIP